MKKWICPVCGYVYEGENPPAECPVCHVAGSKFTLQEGEMKLAAEHEYGIYAKTVKNNPDISDEDKKYIFEQLMANFNGECGEVGMYLCMARIAAREGYPEVALYWDATARLSRACWSGTSSKISSRRRGRALWPALFFPGKTGAVRPLHPLVKPRPF